MLISDYSWTFCANVCFSSFQCLIENLPRYMTSLKKLPSNLKDKVVDLMCKRGLIIDANLSQVSQRRDKASSFLPVPQVLLCRIKFRNIKSATCFA